MRTKKIILTVYTLFLSTCLFAAGGTTGTGTALDTAATEIKGYFNTAVNIFYAVCAIMGLIGAFKVYSKWSSGDPDTTKTAAGWFGGLIFAALAVTVLKSVFVD
jgi:hypothetical protein